MKNILITGGNGQLGNELKELVSQFEQYEFQFTDVDELDITRKEAVKSFVASNKVDAVINCAAYTAVDKAEEEPEKAMKINALAVENLAQVCSDYNVFMLQISTDYVFDGKNYRPYTEDDIPVPLSVYAKSKFEGEQYFMKNIKKGALIRTSWLYSSFGNNFVKTMLRLGKEREELEVVFDQIGTPTYAKDLALAAMHLIEQHHELKDAAIFHFSNEGVASWYDFAYHIMQRRSINCKIKAVTTKQYPLPAKRPQYSLMNKEKFKQFTGLEIRHWTVALDECLKKIKS